MHGAIALAYHHPDPSQNAVEANAAGAECFINIVIAAAERSCTTAYYRGFQYESPASRSLAELIQAQLPQVLGLDDHGTLGLALPILRETKMPAVEIRLGAPAVIVQHTVELAQVVVSCLHPWMRSWDELDSRPQPVHEVVDQRGVRG